MRGILRQKKGQIGGIAGNVIVIGVAGIILVLLLVIQQEVRDTELTGAAWCNATDQSGCDLTWQAANDTLGGMGTFGDFMTIIVLAVVGAIVISIIFGAFGGVGQKR